MGESVNMCVTVTNLSSSPRMVMEHLDAQRKKYNSNPRESFWKKHNQVHIQPGEGEQACTLIIHRQNKCEQTVVPWPYLIVIIFSTMWAVGLVTVTFLFDIWNIYRSLKQKQDYLQLAFFFTSFMCILSAVLKLYHTIPSSEYESVLAADDIVNLAVVIKDVRTTERVLATQEFSLCSPQITIEVEPHPASLSFNSQSITHKLCSVSFFSLSFCSLFTLISSVGVICKWQDEVIILMKTEMYIREVI